MELSSTEIAELELAWRLLENPGLAARISAAVGSPIERGFELLPKRWNAAVIGATHKAIETALDVALRTLDHDAAEAPSNRWHKLAAGTAGAAGGAFGLPALAIELPVSTTIILRSIADIARSEGEDLRDVEARLQCMQVLALGGRSSSDDAAETAYFTARAAMAKAVSEAARHLAQRGAVQQGAPVILQLITQIASRFSINVSQKVAAQAVPVVGAIGGAVINTVFIDHFQGMARGHFIIRRLERWHGADTVQRVYKGFSKAA
ncbi:MAG TPA: EcsC family protein [Aromatoleum sp.]|uniref:EcsC family protein n=1 Tax=Aromatoleum sp. TaxID=2307007 RepID=UPI002B47602A|nr:EcsC family protein [Aromatoleum sp.]HJV28785.1 EcsC family protein [Aromatoleum sp.]